MAEITQVQIATWKKQHGDVFEISVEDKRGYFKAPDRATLSYAFGHAEKDPLRVNEVVAKNCFLGGDEDLLNKDSFFLAVSSKLGELVKFKEATLKKL